MFPAYIPSIASNLTEFASIELVKQVRMKPIKVSRISQKLIPTAYACQGQETPPLLLLHGFDSSLLEFRRVFPLLSREKQVFLMDLLGFGLTERLEDITFSPDSIKAHLFAFWKTLINRPMVLVGASMGGAVALDFTLSYPRAVRKLILIDSAGLSPKPIMSRLLFSPLDNWATTFLRSPKVRQNISEKAYFDKTWATEDARLCTSLHLESPNWDKALITFTKSGGYGSYAKELNKITIPTLILWGEHDKILGTKGAKKFAKKIPNSQLVWIENCGHVPHLEKPQATAEEILKFV